MSNSPDPECAANDYPRRAAAQRTTRRLLSSATEAFGEHGYEATRVSDIARSCSLSIGAVYARWPTKLDLFQAVIDEASQRRLLHAIKESETTALDKLTELGVKLLDTSRVEIFDLWTEACVNAGRNEVLRPAVARFQSSGAEALAAIIEEGKETGDINPALGTSAIVFFCQALSLGAHLVICAQRDDPDLPSEVDWRSLIDKVVDAIR